MVMVPEILGNEEVPVFLVFIGLDSDGKRNFLLERYVPSVNASSEFASRGWEVSDQLEAAGIVSPNNGSKGRQVLIMDEYSLEKLLETL